MGVGVTSSGVAIVAALAGVLLATRRWSRRRAVSVKLAGHLGRLAKIDRRIAALAVDLEQRQTEGTGWGGWDLPPPHLQSHWTYLDGLQGELEFTIAEVRALDAEVSGERLRGDVEELADVLRRVARLYRAGSAASYRASEGKPTGNSAGGSAPIKPLQEVDLAPAESLRLRTQLLFRTCHYRLAGSAGREWAEWPIYEWEAARLEGQDLWGGSPRPIE